MKTENLAHPRTQTRNILTVQEETRACGAGGLYPDYATQQRFQKGEEPNR